MQTLQVVQKSFNSMGFDPKREPFNYITVGILVLGFSGVSIQWIFLLHVADSPQERMESMYVVAGCTGVFLSYTTTIFITKELFSFINAFDELTNKSK